MDGQMDTPSDGIARPEFVMTPNWYFDRLLREDDLCVAKVVGALIYMQFERRDCSAKDESGLPMSVSMSQV